MYKNNYLNIYNFFIKKKLTQMWAFLGIALLLALLGAPVPYLFGYLIDTIIPLKDTKLLIYIVITLTLLSFSQIIISYINSKLTFKVKKEITIEVIDLMLSGMFRIPYEKRSKIHSGELISRLTRDVDELYFILPFGIANLVYHFLFSLILVTILFFINWKLSLMLLVIIPFIILAYKVFDKELWKFAFKDAEASANNMKYLNEVISADYEIKAYGAEKTFKKLAMQAVINFQKIHYKRLIVNEKMNTTVQFFPVVATIIVWYVAGSMAIEGTLTIGLIVTYTTTIGLIIPSIMEVVEYISEYPNQIAVFERVKEFANKAMDEEPINDTSNLLTDIESLSINDIDFSYQGSKQKIFDNYSFEFVKGKKYLIKAPNGFGKSTLFSLLCNHLTPLSGKVLINNTELSTLTNIHRYITLLPQQANIISDTIRNNLSFGNSSITDEVIKNMINKLGLKDWFDDKEQGLDHVLALSKQQLSGGQIQKIGLARAFLRNTKILLLDEPTNNLDNSAVNHLLDIINTISKDTICLIISHDDRIYPHMDEVLNLSFEHNKNEMK